MSSILSNFEGWSTLFGSVCIAALNTISAIEESKPW